MKLHQAMLALRKQQKKTQSDVANIAGIAQSDLSQFEHGKTDVRLSTFLNIATALEQEVMLVPFQKAEAVRALLESDMTQRQAKTPLELYGISDDDDEGD